jgi:carbon-monoxide dehydrogenase medium subunit
MKRIAYYKPRTLDEAWELKAKNPGARFIAGGTDLLVKMKNRAMDPPALISLRSISELRGIDGDSGVRIGAMTTIAEIAGNPVLAEDYPVLVEAAKRLGSVQVRNAATIGGNLCNCSPCADTALPLLVLEARVVLTSPAGAREVPLDEFFLGPGKSCLETEEILAAVLLDPPPKGRGIFMKKGRVKMDLAVASLAVLMEAEGGKCRRARIAAGSVAPVPLRLHRVEEFLEEEPLSDATIARARELAKESVSPITDIRSTEEYRREIVGVYLARAIRAIADA